MNDVRVRIPSEAALTIRKPTAGWQVELLTTMNKIDSSPSFLHSDFDGRRP
jgi:hypothetical protein